jgi:hypothetical protein
MTEAALSYRTRAKLRLLLAGYRVLRWPFFVLPALTPIELWLVQRCAEIDGQLRFDGLLDADAEQSEPAGREAARTPQ